MKIVPLRPYEKGLFAFVDDEDYKLASSFSWYPTGSGHAIAKRQRNCVIENFSMHRLILGAKTDEVIDHLDMNPLNNTRANLRITTHRGNSHSQRKQRTRGGKPTTSRFKGVCWQEGGWGRGTWAVHVSVDGRQRRSQRRMGYFADEADAARAYDDAARKHYGRYARLNFPRDGELGI